MTASLGSQMWRLRLLAFLFPVFLSAPFLNRAFFVDDSYFVEIAAWLAENPGRPYDFRTDDAGIGNPGWEKDGLVRMVNPLLHQYILAGALEMGGGSLRFLRFVTVFLTGLGAVFVFELARRWTSHPLAATALTALSPPWWLTAHSLLIDSTMGAFLVAGLYFFIRSAETDSLPRAILSGALMGAAILTKYPALFVLPLTASWVALNVRKVRRPWTLALAWLIALAFLAAYSGWTASLYGKPHIVAASQRMLGGFGWAKVLSLLVFFSGASLLPLISWAAVSRKSFVAGFALGATTAGALTSAWGGFGWPAASLIGLWVATTALFCWNIGSLRSSWIWPRDAFLIVWIAGFLGMMLMVMDWVAVRYFHIVAPALAMVAVRVVEMRWPGRQRAVLAGLVAFMAVAGGALAYADYRQAEPNRQIGPALVENGFRGGDRRFYLGDSFTVSYLRRFGWTPLFPQTELRPGDLVLAKEVTMPLVWFARKPIEVRGLATFDFPSRFPLKVMDMRHSAGFYASVWGALPFTFSSGPWERFRLYRVTGVRQGG